jgi:hypothetical protein
MLITRRMVMETYLMKDRRSLILFLVLGVVMGLAGILNVTARADLRAVDVMQLFVGGMVTGAALTNFLIRWRSGTA